MTRIVPIGMIWRDADVIDPADGTVERRKVMVPGERYRRHADRQYEDGAEYPLVPVEARSRAAHSRYFAALKEAFDSIPESISARWENVEHFRKWVLVETGWLYEKEFTFEGHTAEKEARRLAAFIRAEDEYARLWVTQIEAGGDIEALVETAVGAWNETKGRPGRNRMHAVVVAVLTALRQHTAVWKVIVRKAKSQDHASMAKAEFKDSSDAVLDYAASLIGTSVGDLNRARSA